VSDLATVLVVTLTLLPGYRVDHINAARTIAREVWKHAGCADVRIEFKADTRRKEPLEVHAFCRRFGPPSPGTPEGRWSGP
jgi:hypothetical protein